MARFHISEIVAAYRTSGFGKDSTTGTVDRYGLPYIGKLPRNRFAARRLKNLGAETSIDASEALVAASPMPLAFNMLVPLRHEVCREVVAYSMIFSMLVVVSVPFLGSPNGYGADTAEWLRKRLHVTADAEFYRAVDVALAASPRSMDEFLEVFVTEYAEGDALRSRLEAVSGFPDSALRHLVGAGLVSPPATAIKLRKKKILLSAPEMLAILSLRTSIPISPGSVFRLESARIFTGALVLLSGSVPRGP